MWWPQKAGSRLGKRIYVLAADADSALKPPSSVHASEIQAAGGLKSRGLPLGIVAASRLQNHLLN